MSEYADMLEKANAVSEKLDDAEGDMSAAQNGKIYENTR